jgi:hypothetical protein
MFDIEKIREDIEIAGGGKEGDFEPNFDNMQCNLDPGSKVRIRWLGEYDGIVDIGYVIYLPGQIPDPDFGAVIYVPHPDNPAGKDRCEVIWISACRLSTMAVLEQL